MIRACSRRALCTGALIALGVLAPASVGAQARWDPGVAGQPLPDAPFRTWSLFLVCNPEWLLAEKQGELAQLYERFRAFGDAIGPRHLAAWFWKRPPRLGSERIAEDLDVDRSSEYCVRLGVRPSEGPHVVVTIVYPERWQPGEARVVLAVNGLPAKQLTKLISTLTDQIMAEKLSQEELDSERYWRSWARALEALGAGLATYVKKVTLSIDTKVVKLEIIGGGN
jgi:hypothetical protein